jgi:hypothetical protein
MSDETLPNSEIILYRTEDGRTRIQCRFEEETVWLTQKLWTTPGRSRPPLPRRRRNWNTSATAL